MARVVENTNLQHREKRLRLAARKKPYWMPLSEGEHLGYFRGLRVGKWVARYRGVGTGGNYQEATIAQADDYLDADGQIVLNFKQAQQVARKWFEAVERNGGRATGPYTVSMALDDYLEAFTGKDIANTRRRVEAIIRPQLGKQQVSKLTAKAITDWHLALAKAPALLRSAKGAEQNVRETPDTDEGRRRRRASANRILTILKAALNLAYRNGKAATDDSWRRVKPFAKVDAPKLRYLSDDEARRLVNAVAPVFRPMVKAALLTGARYSELARLEARDFDPQSRTVMLRETKASKPRAVYLESEGLELFAQATAGKIGGAIVFPRPDGNRWSASQQTRPLAAASEAASLDRTGFHDLRRTYGARLAVQGVPLAVIAEALGHADERITRRHYAHLCPSYVADTVRNAVAGLGIVESGNVVSIAGAR